MLPRDLEVLKGLERERRKARRALAKLRAYGGNLQLGAGIPSTPVRGPIVSPFGQRWGRLHAGVDIAAPAGRPIYAAEAGRVAIASVYGGYGNYLCIQHSPRVRHLLRAPVALHRAKGRHRGPR